MEYKVCFYMTRIRENGKRESWGKLHYRGRTLEEAVEKIQSWLNIKVEVAREYNIGQQLICTSFLIQRGRERGKNFKYNDYITSERWLNSLS